MNASFQLPRRGHPPSPRAGGLVFGFVVLVTVAAACSRSEAPAPAVEATVVGKATTAQQTPAISSVASSPGHAGATNLDDFSDTADFEWDLAEEADGPDFEIDAAVTAFYMPRGNIATFKAKALNGTPPFKFDWNFGDDTPHGSGEMVKHAFHKTGKIVVVVIATDASGAEALMELRLLVAHPVDYAIRMQEDPQKIEELKKQFPDWVPNSPAPLVPGAVATP